MNKTVLVVTQDPSTKIILFDALSSWGDRVLVADAVVSAREQLQRHSIDAVITEIGPQGISHLDCFDKLANELLRMSAVVIAVKDTPVRVLSEVIRLGTSQLIIKPLQEQELLSCLSRALRGRPLLLATPPLRRRDWPLALLVGWSPRKAVE